MLQLSRPAAPVERQRLLDAAVAAGISGAVTTRFAPAPTGFLHLGHVLNAIYVWGVARALEARVVLRIEDHDRQRSRPAFEAAMLEDLGWLGLEPDAAVRQSDRSAVYEDALQQLRAQGLTYACDCSRRRIAGTRHDPPGELRYNGRCRTRGLDEGPGHGIRLRIDAGTEAFDDLLHGPQVQDPAVQAGDVLLRDRHGLWTYQFAATVDDVAQGITLVIRGDDLLASTGRQLRIARLLGRATRPVFLHHPLIMKSATQKISKSDADTGIRELRAAGWSPARVLGFTAALAGLAEAGRDVQVADLATLIVQ